MITSEELQRQVSQEKLENLLRVHGEENSLDFKRYFSPSSQRARAELVRDILAFANTEGGGHIVFGVEDKTYEPIGISIDVHLDTTTIYKKLNDPLGPKKGALALYITLSIPKLSHHEVI